MRVLTDQMVSVSMLASGLVILHAQATAPALAPGQQVLPLMLGAALLLAPWVRALRWPAVAAGAIASGLQAMLSIQSPGGLSGADAAVALALGLAAVQMLREARWNGMVPLRPEAW